MVGAAAIHAALHEHVLTPVWGDGPVMLTSPRPVDEVILHGRLTSDFNS